ncbi:protein translocase subunit SecD [Variovorax sp. PCZ-1]|uniref:protein translocase subunit SecD n=1 Tax=Variovorax sp. PCZ-1 TaxID=2835533 RepID=UPI001BD183DF|nr:protein translocase subunit SecD [Variovorax sp. PCZ-1]MBS7808850.1 protein translocase subunit SecD [Variovorax sp. PCZ-1]
MNRYPLWKYIVLAVVVLISTLYTLPNFFGEAPAVQVSGGKATIKIDATTRTRVEDALKEAKVVVDGKVELDNNSVRARFATTEVQKQAQAAISSALNPDKNDPSYVVALNLVPQTPQWLRSLHANPMYLGLDLRGGIHLMLQVDMAGAIDKRIDTLTSDIRTSLRGKDIRGRTAREGNTVVMRFSTAQAQQAAKNMVDDQFGVDLGTVESTQGTDYLVTASIKPDAIKRIQESALKQNISTLNNRVNELGVAEPVIQQQGADRIVVQLPGVQDTATVKKIIGRIATLQVRMVDESSEGLAAERGQAAVPFGSERYLDRNGQAVIVKRDVIFSGENLTDAQAGFDSQTQEPSVNLSLDAKGARIFKDVTRENVNKRMAILLFEKGKGEVVTAPVIRSEIAGGRVQISGRMTTVEANDTALLLRAGSLAAPMEIIEERTIGPSLGADNIAKGFNSVIYGFLVIAAFMCVYYRFFGVISTVALSVNLLMLVSILSMIQATLTLPGMAAIALALGMAIDSNVLINERIREELRNGKSPQQAIHAGYENAWATILDSNITTLIAGIALLIFGSGPVRGFAVVHCLGILTSMFSAVFFSRGLVNLWYGGKKKLKDISIGQVWRPEGDAVVAEAQDLEEKPALAGMKPSQSAMKNAAPALKK